MARVDETYADETRKGEVEVFNSLLQAKDKKDVAEILAILRLRGAQLDHGAPLCVVSTGSAKLIVPIENLCAGLQSAVRRKRGHRHRGCGRVTETDRAVAFAVPAAGFPLIF
jgi:hypothetical protein